jgi:tRNA threonylcarbamoyladenosine dehydratase
MNTQEALSNQTEIQSPELRNYTLHRRFDRFARLVGDLAMKKMFDSHVMIMGVGGVGSFVAESLARSGIGKITLVDFDDICITNSNRQLHALTGVVGKKKAVIMAERLQKINPQAEIIAIEQFYNETNSEEILARNPDLVIDCIDNLTAKCHLLATCHGKHIPVMCSGGASAKEDPLQVKFADLADTHTDPFLLQVRRILRQKYAFPSEGAFNIPTVFSTEAPTTPFELKYDKGLGFKCVCPQGQNNFHSCENRNIIYGTASYVTGAFGLVLASRAVSFLKSRVEVAPVTLH